MKPEFEPPRRRSHTRWLLCMLCAACANGAGSTLDPGAGGASNPSGNVSCVNDARVDAFAVGLEKPGLNGTLLFRLEQSEPAPPAKGNNTLTLSIRTPSGEVLSGELDVTLKMPNHAGHESLTVPKVTFDAASATYTVTPVDLFMAGLWQITIFAHAGARDAGTPIDSSSFYFCIQG